MRKVNFAVTVSSIEAGDRHIGLSLRSRPARIEPFAEKLGLLDRTLSLLIEAPVA